MNDCIIRLARPSDAPGAYHVCLKTGDFGKDGERIVILLGGSAKKRQSAGIAAAQAAWAAYKRAKAGKGGEKWH